ncbi:FadR/GntR family transcriptional regulator [Microtetraspora malaysiensis]|uniref:FadR/GntR family transcriptional regulator n=1 Tax=Microtetraspora malaysiensis TaxID=161358 RepID=UPI00082E6D5E|nr:FCD domain-containing protein [Microtetraspora malaysiensis]
MQPVARNRKSLVDLAIEQIRSEIRAGTWPVGYRLPSEIKLAEQLGMSRAPVREATRALVHTGLLASRQGDGTYVVALDETDTALRRRLRTAEVVDIIAVRRGLDVAAARGAALQRTDDDLKALDNALKRRHVAASAGDEAAFRQADLDFHLGVANAAHNGVLSDLYRSLSNALEASVELRDCFDPAEQTLSSDHEDQLAAIRDQDPAQAAALALVILDSQEIAVRGRVDE